MRVMRSALGFGCVALAVMLAFLLAGSVPAAGDRDRDARGEWRDPLLPMLHRIDRYFQSHEVDGVVLDARVTVNETEAVRLSVVSQLLAYTELYKVHPTRRFRRDIVDRGDYLIGRLDQVHSGTVFDGVLGYAFLDAYEVTHLRRFFDAGQAIVDEIEGIPSTEYV